MIHDPAAAVAAAVKYIFDRYPDIELAEVEDVFEDDEYFRVILLPAQPMCGWPLIFIRKDDLSVEIRSNVQTLEWAKRSHQMTPVPYKQP